MKKIYNFLMASVFVFFISFAHAGQKVVLDGSTTVGPIAKAFAEYFMAKNPSVNITVSESGSGNGAKSLLHKTCDIANMSRPMKGKEFKAAVANGVTPVAHVVALDGIAIIVHPSNPVADLTVKQIKNIYLGKIRNWSELGGPNRKIVIINRDSNSGTFETFEKLVMKKAKVTNTAEYVGSNGAARQRVQSTSSAIAYVGVGFIDSTVKALKVNGVYPKLKTIQSGAYPIVRPLFMYTDKYPKIGGTVYRFITTYLTRDGQEIIRDIGFIPVTAYK